MKFPGSGIRFAGTRRGDIYAVNGGVNAPWRSAYHETDYDLVLSALTYDESAPEDILAAFRDQFFGNHQLRFLPGATTAPEDEAPFLHSEWLDVPMPPGGKPVTSMYCPSSPCPTGVTARICASVLCRILVRCPL